jgi:hypothetical protein
LVATGEAVVAVGQRNIAGAGIARGDEAKRLTELVGTAGNDEGAGGPEHAGA